MMIKELAAVSGVPKRAIDSYLLHEKPSIPSADNAVKLARALQVTVEFLVSGEDASFPPEIRATMRNFLRLGKKDRKIVAVLINALLDK